MTEGVGLALCPPSRDCTGEDVTMCSPPPSAFHGVLGVMG
uniref:Uncharacterized protein n=1 Tax=Siphoviridae sp. ct0eR1 TaxID=2825297 RepID=A0A8S5UH54_9CAUD|nr:MAG TPA: hypothetical protein [Siphoviridae sp. ct0eR1]